MADYYHAIKSILDEDFKSQIAYPSVLSKFVSIFTKVHFYYRIYRLGSNIQKGIQNSNANALTYASALDFIGSSNSRLAFPLKIALTAKCAQDLLNETTLLKKKCDHFRDTLFNRYPKAINLGKKNKRMNSNHTFSFIHNVKRSLFDSVNKVQNVGRSALDVCVQTFKLSARFSDALLILKGDQLSRIGAYTEMMVDWQNYQKDLKNNSVRIWEEIEKRSVLVDRILKKCNIRVECKDIIQRLKEICTKIFGSAILKNVYDAAKETSRTFFIPGKMTGVHIDLSSWASKPPVLPKKNFPNWGGAKI